MMPVVLKIEVVEPDNETVYVRHMKVEGVLPLPAPEHEESYDVDARAMLEKLGEDFNPIGVQQVVAKMLCVLNDPEGRKWLREICR
jgi:hypothetical protein